MNDDEIMSEIRRTRDALVRECGGDLQRLGEHIRAGEAHWVAAGHPVVSFAGHKPLELPLPDWEKIDAEPEDEIMTEIRATRRKLIAEREAESCVIREEPCIFVLFVSIRREDEMEVMPPPRMQPRRR